MPEGHSIHRIARQFEDVLVGQVLAVSSPQGRFAQGAARIDGQRAVRARAHGKHFFLEFENRLALNVHLGMYGAWQFGGDEEFAAASSIGAPRKAGEKETGRQEGRNYAGPPTPRPTTRVRLVSEHGYADLIGATTCRVLDPEEVRRLDAELGPDPLDPDADPEAFYRAAARTSRPIGVVLMDQKIVSGIGNIYRAEILFRAGLDPWTPSNRVPRDRVEALWRDAVKLMDLGVRAGRIVTTAPEHRPGVPAEAAWPEHANYVYLRHGRPCRVCGQKTIVLEEMAARKLYRCTHCQTRPSSS